jgi:hypothetical protein
MLRVNHQIYDGLIGMWYGTAEFHVRIIWRVLFIFGETITSRDAVLPRNLRLVRSLHISLNLEMPQSEEPDSFSPPIPWMKLITDCLAIGSNKLTEVTLSRITFTPRRTIKLLEFWPDSQNIERFLE